MNVAIKDKDGGEQQKWKHKAFATLTTIINFSENVRPYKNSNPIQMGFIDDLVLMIVNGYMCLFIVDNPWLKQMVLCLCGQA